MSKKAVRNSRNPVGKSAAIKIPVPSASAHNPSIREPFPIRHSMIFSASLPLSGMDSPEKNFFLNRGYPSGTSLFTRACPGSPRREGNFFLPCRFPSVHGGFPMPVLPLTFIRPGTVSLCRFYLIRPGNFGVNGTVRAVPDGKSVPVRRAEYGRIVPE